MTDYTITLPAGKTSLAASETMTVTIQPKQETLNTPKSYDAAAVISGTTAASETVRVEIPLEFTVNPAPTVTLEASPWEIDSGATATLTATASLGTGTYTLYEWSDGTTTWQTSANTDTVNPTVNTYYTVRVKDDSGAWSEKSAARRVTINTYTITATPSLDFGVKSEGYPSRPAAQTVTIRTTGNSPVHPVALASLTQFEVVTPADWTDELPSGGAMRSFTVQPYGGVASGTYTPTLTVSTTEGGSADVALSFIVNGAISASISGNLSIIEGESTTLTANASGGTGSYSYQWSGGGISDTTQSVTVSPTVSTTYTVVVTDQGNGSKSATATVTVTPATHDISLSPASLSFGYIREGYAPLPAQTVTVTNNGNAAVTLQAISSTGFNAAPFGSSTLASGASTTFTLQPKVGLTAGDHGESITVSTAEGSSAALSASFFVTSGTALPITMLPGTAYTVGNCGGDYEVTIGAGTSPSQLDVTNLASVIVKREDGADFSPIRNIDFTARTGSIIITLSKAYLNRLPVGTYTLTAVLEGGLYAGQRPSCVFKVTEPVPDPPKTGDGAQPLLWLLLAALSVAGLASFAFGRRRSAIKR